MSLIESIVARQILDSRGNPTVEVEVQTEENFVGRASVPSGASTGKLEALELRDGDMSVYHGKGVSQALENIDELISPRLEMNFEISEQSEIDNAIIELDGTENKSKLGANACLAVSLACAKAAAEESGLPLYRYLGGVSACTLPTPFLNVINGGLHADNNIDFQEFMIVPHGFDSFSDSLRAGVEIFKSLQSILKDKKLSTAVGDEGGFAPDLKSNEDALGLLCLAVEKTPYKLEEQISFALDVAASSFYGNGFYVFDSNKKKRGYEELIELYDNLLSKYPIISLEDGLDEMDYEGWKSLTQSLGDKVQLVGDDLFVTNKKLLEKGLEENLANSILIKANQIGTLTETLETIELAKANAYTTMISHRSGETEDTFIADLAVAVNSCQIKTGSASRTDRVAKYNQLLRIEKDLGQGARFKLNI